MKKYFAVAVLLLAACRPEPATTHQNALSTLACPTLPGYEVISTTGVDASFCQLKPKDANKLAAEIYIGNFPPPDKDLRFDGFVETSTGPTSWFYASGAARGPSGPPRFVAYFPTRQRFPYVVKLTVFLDQDRQKNRRQRDEVVELVLAHIRAP
jgi:hypothetical protein